VFVKVIVLKETVQDVRVNHN